MCWLQKLDYSSENSRVFLWILSRSPQSNLHSNFDSEILISLCGFEDTLICQQTRQTRLHNPGDYFVYSDQSLDWFLFLRQSCFSSSDSHFNFTCQELKLDLSHMMIYWIINLYFKNIALHTHTYCTYMSIFQLIF